jgi:hypothetical protein
VAKGTNRTLYMAGVAALLLAIAIGVVIGTYVRQQPDLAPESARSSQSVAPSAETEGSTSVALASAPTSGPDDTGEPAQNVRWDIDQTMVPGEGTEIVHTLQAGETLMLSGGRLEIDGLFRGDTAGTIVVLLYRASRPQDVRVTELVPLNNWVGVTAASPEAVLAERAQYFWAAPNNATTVDVLFFEDGKKVDERVLTRPLDGD